MDGQISREENKFSEKGVTDLGGNSPFTDKIRKVVCPPPLTPIVN